MIRREPTRIARDKSRVLEHMVLAMEETEGWLFYEEGADTAWVGGSPDPRDVQAFLQELQNPAMIVVREDNGDARAFIVTPVQVRMKGVKA